MVWVAPDVRRYAVDLVTATRHAPELRLGASPRATLQLVRAARAAAALDGRDYVLPDDVQALAAPVLAHRLLPTAEARVARLSPSDVVAGLVARVPVPDRTRPRPGRV
ncbi:MAG TPA: MoxR family ATPase [Mycobacteriales bacterium]|nr:MoxR family ATPase [Mycobacteriales bacterium]